MSYYPSSLGRFIHNAHKKGYNLKNALIALDDEFKNRRISYYRSDGINHKPITVINRELCRKEIIDLIETEDTSVKCDFTNGILENGSPYLVIEFSRILSPAALYGYIVENRVNEPIKIIRKSQPAPNFVIGLSKKSKNESIDFVKTLFTLTEEGETETIENEDINRFDMISFLKETFKESGIKQPEVTFNLQRF